jgi:hypothetical protein
MVTERDDCGSYSIHLVPLGNTVSKSSFDTGAARLYTRVTSGFEVPAICFINFNCSEFPALSKRPSPFRTCTFRSG